jgi:GT2 family glycosyltransferase
MPRRPAGAAAVRVVVVSYNSGPHLARCLAALAAQTRADFEAMVVDNGSSDGSLAAAVPDDPRFSLMALGTNLGFAAANNRGAAGAATAWLATLNPDAFPAPDWLEQLLRAAQERPAAMFGSTQLADDDPARYDGAGDCLAWFGFAWRGNYRRAVAGAPPSGLAFSPCAAAAMYDRAAFESVGGFDELFFCYAEDLDLGFRLRLAGGECRQIGRAIVRHVGSASTARGSAFALYHGTRNQLWMLAKCMPGPLLALALPSYVLASLVFAAAKKRAGGAVVRGLAAGLAGLPRRWADRRSLQMGRRASICAIARALTWNPLRFLRRDADLRRDEP